MSNNLIFKKILFLTGLQKEQDLVISIFKLANLEVSRSKIKAWRTDLDNPRASEMQGYELSAFFDGLFKYRDLQAEKGIATFNFELTFTY